MEKLGFISIVVSDNWHIANNQHFGDLVYDYKSTSRVFNTEMEAIENAFNAAKSIYNGIKVVSNKGLQPEYNNELSYYGREFHIYTFPVYTINNRDK